MNRLIGGFIAWIMMVVILAAQEPEVQVTAHISPQWESGRLKMEVRFVLDPGYHISANDLLKIKLNLPESLWIKDEERKPETIGPADFPYYAPDPVFLFYYKPRSMPGGVLNYQAELAYQVCSEGEYALCFPPAEQVIPYRIEPIADTSLAIAVSESVEPDTPGLFSQEGISRRLGDMGRGSFIWIYLLVFVGGILTSLTPCVYPMIPIIIGYIGGRSQGRKQAFRLSLFFTLGLSLTYAVLGVLASQTGQVFGSLSQNTGVMLVIAAIFILMGLSMFGMFELQLPSTWMARIQSGKRQGWAGALFMGAVTGFIGAPCVGPVLISLLTFVTTTGSLIKGFFLLLVYGLGMSVLFMIVGTFTGALKSLPNSGAWMNGVKYFFGALMFAMALYFIKGFIPQNVWLIVAGMLLSFIGMVFWKSTGEMDSAPAIAGRTLLLLLLAAGILFWSLGLMGLLKLMPQTGPASAFSPVKSSSIPWIINDWELAQQRAREEQKPMLIDVYATWCVACNELEEKTFSDPEIQSELRRFIPLKLDFSVTSDWQNQMVERFSIRGMPTLILLDSQGEEVFRHSGFIRSHDLILPLKKI